MFASISGYVPQCAASALEERRRAHGRALRVWGALTACALLVVGLVLAAPLASAGGHAWLAQLDYRAFHAVCHQIPERSFYVAGYPLAVCARCAGIYAGFVSATLVYPLLRDVRSREMPGRVWLLAAMLPLAVDFSLGFFGLWENTHVSRFATGALAGAVAVFYVLPGAFDLWENRRQLFTMRTLLQREKS